MAIRIFVDFDGTIAVKDVGDTLFRRLGGAAVEEAIEAYLAERSSARTCLERKVKAAESLTKDQFDALIDEYAIDPGFSDFVNFCRSHDLRLCILSDGLDYYIDRILERHGIHPVERYANLLRVEQAGEGSGLKLSVEFPSENSECDRCACCKRNIMLSRSGEEDFLVYVGEGYSDRCPAAYADLVFAKDALQAHCQQVNISYLPYRTFADVRLGVEQLLARKVLRPRRRAAIRRAAAWIAE